MSVEAPNINTCCYRVYWCPTAGEYECPKHGGFDVCCEYPRRHFPLYSEKHKFELTLATFIPATIVLGLLAVIGWVVGEGILWLMDTVWVGFAAVGITIELVIIMAMAWTVLNLGRENKLW